MTRALAFGLWCAVAAVLLPAHPMGNFSVSHYSAIELSARVVDVEYVLDFAEIPTFELLSEWNWKAGDADAVLQQHVQQQAQEWARHLRVEAAGQIVRPQVERTIAVIAKGAGGMSIMRVESQLRIPVAATALTYQDDNYPDRAGWKEIVIRAAADSSIGQANPAGADRSQALTAYPQDPLLAPPQDLRASVTWQSAKPVAPRPTGEEVVSQVTPAPSGSAPATAPTSVTTAATAPTLSGQNAPGTVVRGDFLSRLLHQGEIGWGMMLLGVGVAFCLGSVHALSPGHGKTIVAAYLVGSRGTPKHAAILGGMVTFTHTISVFLLGFVTLFLSRYIVPEKLYPILGAISGVSIVWIGGMLLYQRIRGWQRARQEQTHHNDHTHTHDHGHAHDEAHRHDLAHTHAHHGHHEHSHDHDHAHAHAHGLVHSHDGGRPHSHVPEGEISLASLIALGATGGLVPCPSALVLLLSSIALGRVGLGLVLLVGFSAGLAVVLTGIGMTVLYAKHLLPDTHKAAHSGLVRLLPVLSAAVIMCVGILMTGVSLGVIRPIAGV